MSLLRLPQSPLKLNNILQPSSKANQGTYLITFTYLLLTMSFKQWTVNDVTVKDPEAQYTK